MKMWLGAAAILCLAGFGARAAADRAPAPPAAAPRHDEPAGHGGWPNQGGLWDPSWASTLVRRPDSAAVPPPVVASVVASVGEDQAGRDVDVVDAHWMAITMWGEARREGEAGMRAVGHVIANRWRAGLHGSHVTDTVSEAFQFSCWNPGDPNRAAMLNVESLPEASADYRAWLQAKALAHEILSGRSEDPTRGALFYHAASVSPRWSRGVEPAARIGDHLFFRTAA